MVKQGAEQMIDFLRTPDERFVDLPGYDFSPHYIAQDNGLRMHYLDEGSGDHVFLCLHGQPTWSYLYRKMIPPLSAKGRVIAPDFFGFGRSDKPIEEDVYSFDFHRNALIALIHALDLTNITLVCQDWGGLLGLTIPLTMPSRFTRLIVMNTGLGTGDRVLGPGFEAWKQFNRAQKDLNIASLLKRSTPILSDLEAAAYAAPFPDARYKAGVRQFPELVPSTPDSPGAAISRAARDWWKTQWNGKSFMAIGEADPVITPDAMLYLHSLIRGCPAPLHIAKAGHFVQEWGDQVASAALLSFSE
jgi:pimeloyl-ACP methyl ester carboxylesterase